MTNSEKHAGPEPGYLADDRDLRPTIIALIAIVVVWSLVYLLGGAGLLGTITSQPSDRQSSVVSAVDP
jgi:hypothetical protein